MAVEAAEEEKLPTKSTAANKMDETKKASIEFGIPKKRKPRGLLIPGLNTSIEVRTPKYTTITRAASEPVDVQAELQALRKQVEDLQVHQDYLKDIYEQEYDSRDDREYAVREDMIKRRMSADIERAHLRKQTFNEQMRLRHLPEKKDNNGKDEIGPFMFPQSAVVIALEILRRERPDDLMLNVYITEEYPTLETNLKYAKQFPGRVRNHLLDEVDYKVANGKPVDFKSALTAVGTFLLPVLQYVLRCIQLHPLYTDCIGEERLRILNACVYFFNRRFSYQVWQITQQPVECPILFLEGSKTIRQYRFTRDEIPLDILTNAAAYDINKANWVSIGGKID